MSKTDQTDRETEAPVDREPRVTHHQLSGENGFPYTARAAWETLRDKREKAAAEMFHVAYTRDAANKGQADVSRPVTFVFNGGPGAASAYLHVGALGPQRVAFNDDGTMPPPPPSLVDNEETWLHFSDLVFVDPIGTGFSRTVADSSRWSPDKKEKKQGKAEEEKKRKEYWQVTRDLESLGEFICQYLSRHHRWESPVFIAGESYGGFRVARLASTLQEQYGVGLTGCVLISPALEFSFLGGTDYDVLYWTDVFPSMAAAAHFHGKARSEHDSAEAHRLAAEEFARRSLLPALACGAAMPEEERDQVWQQAADLLGLSIDLVKRREGRIGSTTFTRELLRRERRFVGRYDAAMVGVDPFPDRESYEGPDPTLSGVGRMFTGAINTLLRKVLTLEEDERQYQLLNFDVFENWKFEDEGQMRQGSIGAMDALRYGMALNPDTHVFITHGIYDLITPYFSSNRLADVMKLDPALSEQLTVRHYEGGHMFYTWKQSRAEFFEEIRLFYERAKPGQ